MKKILMLILGVILISGCWLLSGEEHMAVMLSDAGGFLECRFPSEEELNKFLQKIPIYSSMDMTPHKSYQTGFQQGGSFESRSFNTCPTPDKLPAGQLIMTINSRTVVERNSRSTKREGALYAGGRIVAKF